MPSPPFFGGSAGVKIAFGKKRTGGIELKCAYFRGGETSYNAKPRFGDEGIVIFERLTSTTGMLVPQIGVWVDFRAASQEDNKDGREAATSFPDYFNTFAP